jgi:hypothetical protein
MANYEFSKRTYTEICDTKGTLGFDIGSIGYHSYADLAYDSLSGNRLARFGCAVHLTAPLSIINYRECVNA